MGNVLSVPATKVFEDGTKENIDRKILKEYTVHLICNGESILDELKYYKKEGIEPRIK